MTVTTNLLPNGKQQFLDGNGKPLAGGSVYFYIYPSTTTFKNTWQDPEKSALNTNPVMLDANGEAVIYGDGTYRQVVKDVFGVTIWDEPSIQFVTVGGDLSGQLPNPTVSPNLVANQINSAPNKATPAANDKFGLTDSASGNTLAYILWSQLVTAMTAALEAVFDTRYAAVGNVSPGFANLKVAVTSNSAVQITVDSIAAFTSGGVGQIGRTINVSANLSNSGANGLDTGVEAATTFYFVWLIYNPTTSTWASLLSLSAGSPTLPTGYTYKARVGAVFNDGSSNLWRTLQYGRRVQIITGTNPTTPVVITTGTQGSTTTPTYVAFSLANFVPATAGAAWFGTMKGSNQQIILAPNSTYGNVGSSTDPPFVSGDSTNEHADARAVSVSMVLETLNVYWAAGGSGCALTIQGWEDNL